MLVTIVAVANADNTGLDLDRLEKVEDLDPDVANQMIQGGTGRVPSEKELAAYRETLNAKPQALYDNGGDLPSGPSIVSLDTYEPAVTPTASE
jgi:hypothetical protein